MQTVEVIKAKLEYEKKIQKEFAGCTPEADDYQRLLIANNVVSVLEWVLKDK